VDTATALWILLPLAAVHLALRRDRSALAFQVMLDAVLLILPLRPLALGAHIGPGVTAATEWGAPQTLGGSAEQSDLPLESEVWFAEVRRLIAAGRPPWISDRIGGGVPLYANGQTTLPFPLQLPTWVLGGERGSDVASVWRIELAALGAFLLMGRLRCRLAAATVSGMAFGLNLYLISWVVTPIGWVVTATPWVWYLLVGALRGRRRDAAWLAATLGILAGWSVHPETAAFLWLGTALGGAVLAWGRWRRVRRVAVSLAVGVAVAGVGALPTLAYIAGSSKLAEMHAGPAYPMAGVDATLRARLAALVLVPWREGHPADGSWRLDFASAAVEVAVGSSTVVLVLAARPRRRHRRHASALAVTAATAGCLLWQLPGIAHVLARAPVIGVMMWPRCAFFVSFGIAMLAGLALDAWLRRPDRRRLVVAGLGVQAVVVALAVTAAPGAGRHVVASAVAPVAVVAAQFLPAPVGAAAMSLVVVLESLVAAVGVLPSSAPVDWQRPPALVAELQRRVEAEPGRVMGTGDSLPANLAARWGLADIRSHDPMRPRNLAALHTAFGSPALNLMGPLSTPWAGLAGAWGVRWVVTPPMPPPAAVMAGWELMAADDRGRIYRNSRALPVARVASRAIASPGDAAAGTWEEVDFASSAVVDEQITLDGSGSLEVLGESASTVRLGVRASGTVLVVMHVPMAPGWRASVDGEEAPLHVADLAAMGVVVSRGVHEVRFDYWPTGLVPGAALTLAGLGGCVLLARRRRVR